MKKLIPSIILSLSIFSSLHLGAVDIGPISTTVDLPTASGASPETFDVVGSIDTSLGSGNAIEGNLNAVWTINNPRSDILSGLLIKGADAGISLGCISVEVKNEKGGNIEGVSGVGVSLSTFGDSVVNNLSNSTITGSGEGVRLQATSGNASVTNDDNSSIASSTSIGVAFTTAQGDASVTNTNSSSISGQLQGISFGGIGGVTPSQITVQNMDSTITAVDGAGIVFANTVSANAVITNNNLIQSTNRAGIESFPNAITSGGVTINNNGSTANITGTSGINLASMNGAAVINNLGGMINGVQNDAISTDTDGSGGNTAILNDNGIIHSQGATSRAINVVAEGSISIVNKNGGVISNQGNREALFASGVASGTNFEITNENATIRGEGEGGSTNAVVALMGRANPNGSVIINNTGSSALITVKDSGTFGRDGVQVILESESPSCVINNTSGARIEGQDEGIQLQTSNPGTTGTSNFTINNSGGSVIKTFGNFNQPTSLAGILTAYEASDSHTTINNSGSGSLIEGKTAGIQDFDLGGTNGSITVNNSATITGTAGPAILMDPGSETDLTVNLMTGSVLNFSGNTVVRGADVFPATNTLNLTGDGSQAGDFEFFNALNKNGTGTWTLTPNTQNAFGFVSVNAGTLVLNGLLVDSPATTLSASEVTVFSGAVLGGTNQFGLAADNSILTVNAGGTHKPGNSIGTTTVNGTYNLNGTLEVEYNADTLSSDTDSTNAATTNGQQAVESDLVIVSTAVNISNAKVDAKKLSGIVEDGDVIFFLKSPDAVASTTTCDPDTMGTCYGFSQILNRIVDGRKLILQQSPNGAGSLLGLANIDATLIDLLFLPGNPAPSPNAIAIAQNLDNNTPPPASELAELQSLLLSADPEDLNELLNLVSSAPLADTSFLTSETIQDILQGLRGHLAYMRNNNPPARRNSLWDQFFYDTQDRNSSTQFAGLDARTFGYAIGYDGFLWDPHFQVGGLIGYTHTSIDRKLNLGSAEINSIFFGPYASWKCLDDSHEGYYLDASFLVGWHDYENKRAVPLLGLVAKSDPNAWSMDARLGGGYNLLLDNMLFTPFGYVDYLWTRQEAFTETGAGNAGFSMGEQTYDMMRYELGTAMSQKFDLTCALTLVPKLSLSWVLKDPVGN